MSDASRTTPPLPDEPGIGSVILETLKGAAKMAFYGAATGLVGVTIAHFSGLKVDGFFDALGMGGGGEEWIPLLAKGTLMGAATGMVVGASTGGLSGVSRMQHYYHDVALPAEHEIGKAQGVQIGAALEHEAAAHEAQGRQYREAILQESNVKGQIAI